jgi:hypothetical protein
MDPIRAAAREVVTTLRNQTIMAEYIGLSQVPSGGKLKNSERFRVAVLVLGGKYGAVQRSPGHCMITLRGAAPRIKGGRPLRIGKH